MTKQEFQRKIYSNLASKKFQALLGAVIMTISTAIASGISWTQAQVSVAILVAGYLGVQGLIDNTKAKRK
jgi:hypothetical protein